MWQIIGVLSFYWMRKKKKRKIEQQKIECEYLWIKDYFHVGSSIFQYLGQCCTKFIKVLNKKKKNNKKSEHFVENLHSEIIKTDIVVCKRFFSTIFSKETNFHEIHILHNKRSTYFHLSSRSFSHSRSQVYIKIYYNTNTRAFIVQKDVTIIHFCAKLVCHC